MRHDIGRTDAGRESMRRLRKEICRSGRIPHYFLASYRARPHQIQHRDEVDLNIDGACTLHFVADDRARLIERNEEFFVDYEIGSGVNASHRFGTVDDSPQ